MKLTFEVNNQTMVRTDKNKVVAGSRNYLYAEFDFLTKDWDGITKTAIFRNGNKSFKAILDQDNTCLVPWEVLECGTMIASVFGGDLITTNSVNVSIMGAGYSEGEASSEPTPDVYAQIIQMIDEIKGNQSGTVSEEYIGKAVADYLVENPISGVDEEEVKRIAEEYVNDVLNKSQGGGNDLGIVAGYRDKVIIPDKYNAGCNNEEACVNVLEGGVTLDNGIKIRWYDDKGNIGIDMRNNTAASGTYVFENYDISDKMFVLVQAGSATSEVEFVFNNCKFKDARMDGGELVKAVFNNCTFGHVAGSYLTFNECSFGAFTDVESDPVNPSNDCIFNNCYIYDMCRMVETASTVHKDGLQVVKTVSGENIELNNCRFEVPSFPYTSANGSVNVALFSQIGSMSVKDCIINGGGYYTISGSEYMTFSDSYVGGAYRTSAQADGTLPEGVSELSKLFVTSVYKENGKIILHVTNDTNEEKTLIVKTNNGSHEYTIPKYLKYSEMTEDVTTFDDLPIDIEYTIDDNADYVVCYDGDTQIRFVDFAGNGVGDNSASVNLNNYYTKGESYSKTEVDELLALIEARLASLESQ